MNIANNIIKYHLKNVFFISGTACGGKTTAAKHLSYNNGMILYDWDDHFLEYQAIANSSHQPLLAQRREISSWEEYFMRPVEEYAKWLEASFVEQTGMVIADLLKLVGESNGKRIIVDGFFTVDVLEEIADHDRVVFLLAKQDIIKRDYFNREDKQNMLKCIMGLKDPQTALENVFKAINYKADEKEKAIHESGFKYFIRESVDADPMVLIEKVKKHFGFTS